MNEGAPTNPDSTESLKHYLRALSVLEDKYRQGDIRLEDLLYGYDQVQEKFYGHLNPDASDYKDTWQAAVTYDGFHYTKLKSTYNEKLPLPQNFQHDLSELLERIGNVLDQETIQRAKQKVSKPDLTNEGFKDICSHLFSLAIRKLNGDRYFDDKD